MEEEWKPFNEETLSKLTYGAYLLRNSEGVVVYIGCGEVASRLWAHFWEREKKKEGVVSFKIIWCADKEEASATERRLLDEHMREHGEFPKYNRRK